MPMENKRTIYLVMVCMVVLGLVACTNNKPVPKVASPAGSIGYAESYHTELAALSTAYKDRSDEARKTMAEFPTYADQLKDPDWALAASVIERADEAGQSLDYAEAAYDDARVRAFFEEEQDDIARRLSGTVKSEIEKSGCTQEIEVQGKLAYAHKDAVNKALEDQLNSTSEAHRIIELESESIGKKNAKTLEEQAQDVS